MAKGNTGLILGVLGLAGAGAAVWYFMKKKDEGSGYYLPNYAAGAYVPQVTAPVGGSGGLPMPGGSISPKAFYPAGKDTSGAGKGAAYGKAPIFQPGLTAKQFAQLSTLPVPMLLGQTSHLIPPPTPKTASKSDYGQTAATTQSNPWGSVRPTGDSAPQAKPTTAQLQKAAQLNYLLAAKAKDGVTKSPAQANTSFTPTLF